MEAMSLSLKAEPRVESARAINWAVVALVMAICCISHLNRISMSIAGDERIMQQYSIQPKEMGMVYSAFLLVYTIFMIPGGIFIDRFGPRASLAVVTLGSAIFCALTGAAGASGIRIVVAPTANGM